jgi:hypothetical protein
VFIGDFWLDRADVRERLRADDSRFGWSGRHPANADFHGYAVERAREIGDPRQLAHAAFNAWRFGRLAGSYASLALGQQALQEVLADHPDLRSVLKAEGYALPAWA